MNINELTIGEAKELAALFGGTGAAPKAHSYVGRHVVCRCYSAGVHAGELVSADGDVVILKNSRRLWQWKAKAGVALSGVAVNGLAASGSKVDVVLPELFLTGVIEIIPTSAKAQESINAA